jgi:hypothetical protein
VERATDETLTYAELVRLIGLLPAGNTPGAFLVPLNPAGHGLVLCFPLGPPPLVLGRSPDCQVVIDHPSVSRAHARIDAGADGEHAIADLGSSNGTFVNGARVERATLRDGDVLRLGDCAFRVTTTAPPAAPRARA